MNVSIPYGTIKSISQSSANTSLIEFQFLMVQLKVLLYLSMYLFNMFQFLMVQLKVIFFFFI